jgi:hypothetical protein
MQASDTLFLDVITDLALTRLPASAFPTFGQTESSSFERQFVEQLISTFENSFVSWYPSRNELFTLVKNEAAKSEEELKVLESILTQWESPPLLAAIGREKERRSQAQQAQAEQEKRLAEGRRQEAERLEKQREAKAKLDREVKAGNILVPKNWIDLVGRSFEFRYTASASMTSFGGQKKTLRDVKVARIQFREKRDNQVRLLYWSDTSKAEPDSIRWVAGIRSVQNSLGSDLAGGFSLHSSRKAPRRNTPGTVGYELDGSVTPARIQSAEDVFPLATALGRYSPGLSSWGQDGYQMSIRLTTVSGEKRFEVTIASTRRDVESESVKAVFDGDGILVSASSRYEGELNIEGVRGEGSVVWSVERVRQASAQTRR